jgi:hypothetical protein
MGRFLNSWSSPAYRLPEDNLQWLFHDKRLFNNFGHLIKPARKIASTVEPVPIIWQAAAIVDTFANKVFIPVG